MVDLNVIAGLQEKVRQVFLHPKVKEYLVRLVAATRNADELALGAGPRATQGLFRACQAAAAISGFCSAASTRRRRCSAAGR